MAIVFLSEFLNIRFYYFLPQKVTKKRRLTRKLDTLCIAKL